MLPTNVAQNPLTVGEDELTQAFFGEKGTATVFSKAKGCGAFMGKSVGKDLFPFLGREFIVTGKGAGIDVNLPADATAMLAVSRNAGKISIIDRGK